ncbi:MAG: DUF3168 domain-containing protein [Alphaproteobacteria bacterium]|nr:DUF3168 domain-containing protein [Alphaproteobacteria bacterium]
MHSLLMALRRDLILICPTFTQRPSSPPYPHIILRPEQSIYGLPWGPRMISISINVLSQYAGTQEILRLGTAVENCLIQSINASQSLCMKMTESTLLLLKDGRTRRYRFRLKARLPGVAE